MIAANAANSNAPKDPAGPSHAAGSVWSASSAPRSSRGSVALLQLLDRAPGRIQISRAPVRSANAALHCCKQCTHFEPSTRFQCIKPIPARIPYKDQANECELFTPRVTVMRDGAAIGAGSHGRRADASARQATPGPPSIICSRSRHMRIAELYEPRRFRFIDAPAPDPARARFRSASDPIGICGSDLHYFSDGAIGDVTIKYPVVLGHEPTGEVVQDGRRCERDSNRRSRHARAGDLLLSLRVLPVRAIITAARICRFSARRPSPASFASSSIYRRQCAASTRRADFDTGTLFEPLAVVLHSMQFAPIRLGETVAVFGAGPIGLLTIAR